MSAIEKLIKWEKDWASQQAYSAPIVLADQAAAELESMQAELAELAEARRLLKPFADCGGENWHCGYCSPITDREDYDAAAAFLKKG